MVSVLARRCLAKNLLRRCGDSVVYVVKSNYWQISLLIHIICLVGAGGWVEKDGRYLPIPKKMVGMVPSWVRTSAS